MSKGQFLCLLNLHLVIGLSKVCLSAFMLSGGPSSNSGHGPRPFYFLQKNTCGLFRSKSNPLSLLLHDFSGRKGSLHQDISLCPLSLQVASTQQPCVIEQMVACSSRVLSCLLSLLRCHTLSLSVSSSALESEKSFLPMP